MEQSEDQFRKFQDRVEGTNINPQTLLASDFLNHLNEPLMLLELVPDMPEMLEELDQWRPKTYVEHFRDSGFTDKDLAIEAYEWSPQEFRVAFEETVDLANRCVKDAMTALRGPTANAQIDEIRKIVEQTMSALTKLVDRANAIIHGNDFALDQGQIDEIMAFSNGGGKAVNDDASDDDDSAADFAKEVAKIVARRRAAC
jgi:hypothetical protein